MTSGDGLEREMWGLHLEGFSVRENFLVDILPSF